MNIGVGSEKKDSWTNKKAVLFRMSHTTLHFGLMSRSPRTLALAPHRFPLLAQRQTEKGLEDRPNKDTNGLLKEQHHKNHDKESVLLQKEHRLLLDTEE